MPELFFAVKQWIAVSWLVAAAGVNQAAAQEADAEKWFQEAEKALAAAEALEMELKEKAAEADGDEEGEEGADDGPEPDFAGAFTLFKKAAEAGHARAALKVSEMLIEGLGVPKSTIDSFGWAVKAAELGDVDAQLLAASKYEEGRGTTKSLSRALKLYEEAFEQGSKVARMKVATLVDRGDPGVQQNRARALPLFQQAAKDGDKHAIYMIGWYLQRGYVVEKDEAAASQWYLRGAEIGEPKCQRKLAIRYFRGTGLQADAVDALMWCELALKNMEGDVETKNLAREYREAIVEKMTPRKVAQAVRDAGKFKAKEFGQISLPTFPYKGPAPTYHLLTDTTGNKLEAAIVSKKADSVLLERRSDGTRFDVPLRRLSEESRKLVEGFETK